MPRGVLSSLPSSLEGVTEVTVVSEAFSNPAPKVVAVPGAKDEAACVAAAALVALVVWFS